MEEQINDTNSLSDELKKEMFGIRLQLELLLSTGAIFSLLQFPDIIINKMGFTIETIQGNDSGYYLIGLFYLLMINYILIIGFSLNLIFRTIYLCYTCIAYFFPAGINKQNLNYAKEIMLKTDINKDQKEKIQLMDKIAGLSFALSIVLIITSLGGFILTSIFALILSKILNIYFSPLWGYTFIFVSQLIVFNTFDYLFFNLFKRNKNVVKLYYPISKFLSWITLSFLIKNELYIFTSNIRRWKFNIILVFFFGVGFYLANLKYTQKSIFQLPSEMQKYEPLTRDYKINNFQYEDQLPEGELFRGVCINSFNINGNSLSLTSVEYPNWLDNDQLNKIYKAKSNSDLKTDEDRFIETERRMNAYSKYIHVAVDDSIRSNLKWLEYFHPKTGERCLKTMLSIGYLKTGYHCIKIRWSANEKIDSAEWKYKSRKIPFWKE